jgi:pyruvate/2-oxoglutarate dehydrogenase complex dihydrolipoamide acyltransferase (E2) component
MADTAKGPVEVVELTRAQQAAVRRVAEARATIPHFAAGEEVDAPQEPILAGLAHAVGAALRELPAVNGAYRDGHLERYARVNVAVALPGPEGPVAPVVFDADAKDRATIATELDVLAARAAAGELTAPELAGATFTIVALHARRLEPVLVSGQAATLGAGAAEQRPVVTPAGELAIAPRMDLTLACDARALSGPEAVAFLAAVAARLA